jgi:hypothetical protein
MGIMMSESERRRQRERDTMSSHRLFKIGIERSKSVKTERHMMANRLMNLLQTKLERLMPKYYRFHPGFLPTIHGYAWIDSP